MAPLYCVNECKHGRLDTGDAAMIRCCLCANWYHEDCLGIQPHDRGVWPCPSCRNLNSRVELIMNNVGSLMTMVSDLTNLLKETNKRHQEENNKLTEKNTTLSQENMDLRKTVADLTVKVNTLSWKSFRKAGQCSNVLVGSSIIRDVCEEKLHDTEIICQRGGCISDAKVAVEKLTPGYETITLVVGGNDCQADPPIPAEDIVKSYSELIDAAQKKGHTVTVSSICPRIPKEIGDKLQEKIDCVNAGLLATCNDKKDIKFVDVTPTFHLADGSINDGYIMQDGVHITRNAMNKMAVKLDLQIKNPKEGVCNSNQAKFPSPKKRANVFERTTTTVLSNESSYCYNCGEGNHVKDRCRYSQPLECHQCHRRGHKFKFYSFYPQ